MFENAVFSNGPTSFDDYLKEEVASISKKVKRAYSRRAFKFSDVIFGEFERMTIPFEPEDGTMPRSYLEREDDYKNVSRLLASHDYEIRDYVEGTCVKCDSSDDRVFKIGKILTRFKASSAIINGFNNSKLRADIRSKKLNLRITFSRNPIDIALMSTNRGWRSCMNLYSGAYNSRVYNDLELGTHIAYVHRAEDEAIKNPICRVLLKPYRHVEKSKKAVLFPERRVYGSNIGGFHDVVTKWSLLLHKKNYLDKPFVSSGDLYNDGRPDTFIVIDPKTSKIPYTADLAVSYKVSSFHCPGVTDKYLSKFAYDDDPYVRHKAIERIKDKKFIESFVDDNNVSIIGLVVGQLNNYEYIEYILEKWRDASTQEKSVIFRAVMSNENISIDNKIKFFSKIPVAMLDHSIVGVLRRLKFEDHVRFPLRNRYCAYTLGARGRDRDVEAKRLIEMFSGKKHFNYILMAMATTGSIDILKLVSSHGCIAIKLLALGNIDYRENRFATLEVFDTLPESIKGLFDRSRVGNNEYLWRKYGRAYENRVCRFIRQMEAGSDTKTMNRYARIDLGNESFRIPTGVIKVDLMKL